MKDFSKFYKYHRGLNGLTPDCKECRKIRQSGVYQKYKDKALKTQKEWKRNNPEKVKEMRSRAYRKAIPKLRERERRLQRTSILYRLRKSARARLHGALDGRYKPETTMKIIGCSVHELKLHLEKQFKDGMCWENYGLHGWHMDHIKPIASYNLDNRDELYKACHYTNLQPLWADENIRKKDKY